MFNLNDKLPLMILMKSFDKDLHFRKQPEKQFRFHDRHRNDLCEQVPNPFQTMMN